jgi:hypothetical protein
MLQTISKKIVPWMAEHPFSKKDVDDPGKPSTVFLCVFVRKNVVLLRKYRQSLKRPKKRNETEKVGKKSAAM